VVDQLEGGPRLRVFENRVLRRIFGAKRDEVTGEWRKIHFEEFNDLYFSPNIAQVTKIKKNWRGTCRVWGGEEVFIRFSVEKPERKRKLGSPSRRWEDNIKMDLQELGFVDTDWIDVAQVRDWWRGLVNTVMNLRVP